MTERAPLRPAPLPPTAAWERVAALADVPAGSLVAARLADGRQLCLANHDGTVFAVLDRCTHQAFPLSVGELLPDGTIECAWHGARFDGASGCVCNGPATEDVETFDVRIADGEVYVRAGDGKRERGDGG